MSTISDQINDIITNHPIVLFMKGTKERPQCGFSNFVVQTLDKLGVDYCDVDVLKDPDIRQGIKDYSDWPTIPQLYIQGEFIGGADIVRDMVASKTTADAPNELEMLLQEKGLI